MKCQICGNETSDDSKYCQKCGNKIEQKKISVEDLKKELCHLKENEENQQVIQYYDTLLDAVGTRPFKKVEYTYTSSMSEDIFSLENIFNKNGNLKISMPDAEGITKLAAAYLINEFESMQGAIANVSMGLHNDRIAYIEAAYSQYKRNENEAALNNLNLGIAQVKKEIMTGINYFADLPRRTLEKLFCRKSVQETDNTLNNLQESFDMYVAAVRLFIGIDAENGNQENIVDTIKKETIFLKRLESYGFQRLLEYDDDNSELWKEKVKLLTKDLKMVNEKLETNSLIFEIEGEYNE